MSNRVSDEKQNSQSHLNELLKESYEISHRPSSPEKIEVYKKNQQKLKEVDWSQSVYQEELWKFVASHLDLENGVLATNVPSAVFSENNFGAWLDFFNQNMETCSMTLSNLDSKKRCFALQSLMSSGVGKLVVSLNKSVEDPNLLKSISRLKDKISSVFEDWSLTYSSQIVSLKWPYFDHGFYLEMGAWLGDHRSFEIAKRALDSKFQKTDRVQRDNFQLALLVLSGFLDDSNFKEVRTILDRELKNPVLSKDFKEFLAKLLKKSGASGKSSMKSNQNQIKSKQKKGKKSKTMR
ncbi:MAG: hypothetical protein KA116_00495 [Proteobacteria bacterium]|nr:hypothetical protein [Pseudomonadota bacterium]